MPDPATPTLAGAPAQALPKPAAEPLRFHRHAAAATLPGTAADGRLAAAGLFLRRHRRAVLGVQWAIVAVYAFLVVVPAFLPLPPAGAHLWDNLRLFAQFVFWGVWWPGVMLATLTLGRVWCGLLCPEGALSEWASRHGSGRPLPRWLKWPGWPLLAFVCTTVYGQLVSVYEYPEAALLVLGGSTVAAVGIGLVYGRGKRVWCRYLCPASGVFAILAKLAPLHYRVDRNAWDAWRGPAEPVNCAPLVDVRRMTSASECHACGRCAGQRGAVALAVRTPFAELLDTTAPARTADALTLLFGVLGVATAAFQWTLSPWLLAAKLRIADWLVAGDHFALLDNDVPWWLLTHYPEAGDLFTWLDGALILAYLLGGGLLLGALLTAASAAAAAVVRDPRRSWQRFALTLTPLGAAGVVLGLSMLTVTHLKAEHVWLGWLPAARGAVLGLGSLATLWLAARLAAGAAAGSGRRLAAWFVMTLPVALLTTIWSLVFFVW